jgi:hypothetical protein
MKTKSNKSQMFVKRTPLTKRERKYCSCLLDVRDKQSEQSQKTQYNPYAVCTNAVYTSQGKRRNKFINCETSYDYEKIPVKSLRNLAKEKKLSIKKNDKMASKRIVISRLTKRRQQRISAYYKKQKEKYKSKLI